MTNSLVGDHHVAVVDVDEGVLEGSDMSGTPVNGFLVKLVQYVDLDDNSLVGDHQVAPVDVDWGPERWKKSAFLKFSN